MSKPEPQTRRSQYTSSKDGYYTLSAGDSRLEGDGQTVAMNEKASQQKAEIHLAFPTNQPSYTIPAILKSNIVAPSPPPSRAATPSSNSSTLAPLDTTPRLLSEDNKDQQSSPASARLRIQTDIIPSTKVTAANTHPATSKSTDSTRTHITSGNIPIKPIQRTPSIKNILASSVGSNSGFSSTPNSALSSPMLNAMADVTPLPSPLMSGDSPGPWRKLGSSRPVSREMMVPGTANAALVTLNGESISAAITNQHKRRAYQELLTSSKEPGHTDGRIHREKLAEGHVRNRSLSEYAPDATQIPKGRNLTVSGTHAPRLDGSSDLRPSDTTMRREPHLAVQRGLAPIPKPPTPPSSRTGGESSDSDSSLSSSRPRTHKKSCYEYFEANTRPDAKRRRWRALKTLGQGTFSRVMLATSQAPDLDDRIDENQVFEQPMDGVPTPVKAESKIDRKKLVAVKICEHGPKGGASEERVEMSLKRELEIMKSINHPSLVHLIAWSIEETRAILVLSYCPGGDLFEVASQSRDLLVPGLLRRMFSELVTAVRYLHERHIVHRDIKLENVLVNLPRLELSPAIDWATYPYSVITLTDLGLSRRVADDEKLTTRCGSDDYAAPEVIMGQAYDGRATDAWSLGVLLYALLESRLPFDPHPGMPESHKQRSRTSHRIARVEWRWAEYAGDQGDHEGDPEKFKAQDLEGAMVVTENLLKRARSRWTMDQVAEHDWIKNGVVVEGGIKFREEDPPEEVFPHGVGIQSPL
ncbi:kinase-like domain-containing protein [Amylocarpus encephaloides]|uniref:Kinase-like domain-containing protein n=1 Tax=Amylocarpus encephaloides TaxID=45428 RepID=A0A9P8BZN4_9HELO|nr:kinase-like domain-containing protein [Amylocarpus encephaloides]